MLLSPQFSLSRLSRQRASGLLTRSVDGRAALPVFPASRVRPIHDLYDDPCEHLHDGARERGRNTPISAGQFLPEG